MPIPETLPIETRQEEETPERGSSRKSAHQAAVPGVNVPSVVEDNLGLRIRLYKLGGEDGGGCVGYSNGMAHDGVEVGCCEGCVAAFRREPPSGRGQ